MFTSHKKNIEKGRYSIEKIRSLDLEGKLNAKDLLKEGIITQEQFEQIMDIPKETHLRLIKDRKYDGRKIKSLVNEGVLDISDLDGVLSDDEIDDLFPPPPPEPTRPINVDFTEWDNIAPLQENRVDIFVLGVANSGKSAFMAGLLYHAWKQGRLPMSLDHIVGAKYMDTLIRAIKRSLLPPATPTQNLQHMSCDFVDDGNEKHPLTFIEMSGEIFEKYYFAKQEDIHPTFREYISSDNRKLLFFTLDYKVESDNSVDYVDQAAQFEYALQFLEANGMLQTVDAVALLITKWDVNPVGDESEARAFLDDGFLNFINRCKEFRDKYDFRFEVFPFSLGDFSTPTNYQYNPKSSKRIFDWICSFTPIKNKPSKKLLGFFNI